MKDEGTLTKRDGNASDHLREQAAGNPQDELVAGLSGQAESIQPEALLAHVLDRANLQRALKPVRRNKGAPGIDGMTVDELPKYLRDHWLEISAQLEADSYCPQPVMRVNIVKSDGNTHALGIPAVLDRFIQQSIAQVISAQWEPHSSNRRIRDPYVRWCGRGKPRGFLLSRFGVIEAGPHKSSASEYHYAMQVVTGTVVGGKVILEGASLPEGTVVTILAKDSEAMVRLPPALQAELEEALDEADREEGISGDDLLEKLRKYD